MLISSQSCQNVTQCWVFQQCKCQIEKTSHIKLMRSYSPVICQVTVPPHCRSFFETQIKLKQVHVMRCLGSASVLMSLMMSGQVFRLREDVALPGLKLQATEEDCMFSHTIAAARLLNKTGSGDAPTRNGKDKDALRLNHCGINEL